MVRALVVSDNARLLQGFHQLSQREDIAQMAEFVFCCSHGSEGAMGEALGSGVSPLRVKEVESALIAEYSIIISAHCKQLFPPLLVSSVRCINVHPGLNPYNRGWFPQVFSILNGLPCGATIHEMDEELDHGAIIAQAEVETHAWDTSLDIYNRVLDKEMELLSTHLPAILRGTYAAKRPTEEGNVNLKKDFNALCRLDLAKQQTIGETIGLLRALTHGDYDNAYLIDPKTGRKVFVSIRLKPE